MGESDTGGNHSGVPGFVQFPLPSSDTVPVSLGDAVVAFPVSHRELGGVGSDEDEKPVSSPLRLPTNLNLLREEKSK